MSASTVDRELVRRAMEDVEWFARACVREPLWPHQLEAARSSARIRVLRAGRQVGKSRLLAVLALWEAFRSPDRHVLILSASEDNAKDLLAEVFALASSSPLLRGSIEDDSMSRVVLSNGSWVRSIPASAKQARGKSIDLLVIDEAAFVGEDVWRAAKYSMAARPGSRLLLASSPYGRRDAFFAMHDRLGMGGPNDVAGVTVETFVWPSTVSPLVQQAGLVEFWRRTDPPRVFAAEVLAEWQDEAGSYFTPAEIAQCVADYELRPPEEGRGDLVVGGLDFGFSVDANALVLLGVLDDCGLNRDRREPLLFVPWLEVHHRMPYEAFQRRALDACDPTLGGYEALALVAEVNGPGEPVAQALRLQARERRLHTMVVSAWTDHRRKTSGMGQLKLWLQRGQLVLPRHPALLRQMEALQFEQLESGAMRIAVPESGGHDDVVMALMQAASAVRASFEPLNRGTASGRRPTELIETAGGVRVPRRPRCLYWTGAYQRPRSPERGDGW